MGKWIHRLTNIDKEKRMANCSNCGLVAIKSNGIKGYRCWQAIYAHRKKFGHRIKYHEVNPGKCVVCGSTNRVAYDHNHKTNKFRGWLCINCNTALGLVHDDINHLQKLIDYLNR